ncbi:Tn3 family transposase [Streptomyces sp. NPDC001796]|uniref:Tn3 family transposase n=1 Tax=Streptomyces sp. NPDC001796 TaxID=3364609 RepID=UPI0036B7958C
MVESFHLLRTEEGGPAPHGEAAGSTPVRQTGRASHDLSREIHGGLQVVKNWNSANTVLHYGKDGTLTGPDKEHAEPLMLALHLLRSSLVHIDTLLLQQVLAEPEWAKKAVR